MRYLVTGGMGFIGSALVRELVSSNEEVVNLDNLTYAACKDNLKEVTDKETYSFIKGDIVDAVLVEEVIQQTKPDFIMHLAAESHVDRSILGPRKFIDTNVLGTLNLLEGALNYWQSIDRAPSFRFQHISTDEVYGSLGEYGKFSEETAYKPNSPYSASKASADHLVRAWHETFQLPVLITNCSNNYGPFQFPEKLIPLIILNAVNGKDLPVYGDGKNVRDWLYVEDHVDALLKVLHNGRVGESYNIGGESEVTNISMVETICSLLDKKKPKSNGSYFDQVKYIEDRPGHDFRYAIDIAKISKELQWKPKISLSIGIEKTIDWYLNNPEWIENLNNKN